jgi:predicted PurR-regulated permease PerM
MSQEFGSYAPRPAEDTPAEPEAQGLAAPLPGVRSVMITGIFVLMLFYTLYFTAEIVVPVIFAVLLKLLLQPGLRQLDRLRVPAPLGAALMIAVLFGVIGITGYSLIGPATSWAHKAPQSLPRLEQRLSMMREPIDMLQQTLQQLQQITQGPGESGQSVTVKGPGMLEYVFSGTRSIMSGLGITVLMLFFMLAWGDLFMRRLVEILPTFSDKKQAVAISRDVESNISAYLLTITVMNALVGLATTVAMWVIGLPDAALWGALAFVLNYVLILGPLTGVAIFFLVGLLSFDTLWQSLLPPAAYLAIHIVEGEMVTPLLVARRFTLNPVLVIGSLIFWDWMWGIPGALLAVPMLAVFKVVCDGIRPLAAIGHFIGG